MPTNMASSPFYTRLCCIWTPPQISFTEDKWYKKIAYYLIDKFVRELKCQYRNCFDPSLWTIVHFLMFLSIFMTEIRVDYLYLMNEWMKISSQLWGLSFGSTGVASAICDFGNRFSMMPGKELRWHAQYNYNMIASPWLRKSKRKGRIIGSSLCGTKLEVFIINGNYI